MNSLLVEHTISLSNALEQAEILSIVSRYVSSTDLFLLFISFHALFLPEMVLQCVCVCGGGNVMY